MSESLFCASDAERVLAFGGPGERRVRDLAGYAGAIAATLPAVAAGAQVVVACADRYRFTASLLASWSRGYRVALPPNGQPDTVHTLLDARDSVGLLHDFDFARGTDVRGLEPADSGAAFDALVAPPRDAVAVVVYTSGSTGEPQPHPKTTAQLLDETRALIDAFDLAGRRVVAAVPPQHIYGLLFGVLVPLLGRGAMGRTSPLHAPEVLAQLREAGADVLVAVPPHLRALLDHGGEWPPVHRVFSSGAPLSDTVAGLLQAKGVPITQILGSTETGGIAHRDCPFALWRPLPGVEVRSGEDGAMWLDSPWLAPDSERPVRCHDRVQCTEAGFRHLGRTDTVVKVAGRRVDVGEVEARLSAVPGVRAVRVLAQEGASLRGLELWVAVEADDVSVSRLRAALAGHMDPVTLPRRFRVVPALPRTGAGKLTRRSLLALFDTDTLTAVPDGEGTFRVKVPPHLVYFRGHFPDAAILPGVVQLQKVALAQARACWPDVGRLKRLTRVKFKRPVGPGEELTLKLRRKGAQAVHFTLDSAGRAVGAGILHFGEADV